MASVGIKVIINIQDSGGALQPTTVTTLLLKWAVA